jgi:hypothetical protein
MGAILLQDLRMTTDAVRQMGHIAERWAYFRSNSMPGPEIGVTGRAKPVDRSGFRAIEPDRPGPRTATC